MPIRTLWPAIFVLALFSSATADAQSDDGATAEGAEEARLPRVLSVGLKGTGLEPSLLETLNAILPTLLSEHKELETIAGSDLERLTALEADRQAAGCDDSSCLSEIADALDAQLLVFGTAGRVGARAVVTLNLYDRAKAKAVARKTVEIDPAANLSEQLRPTVSALLTEGGTVTVAKEPSALAPTLYATGGVLAGAGAVVVLVGAVGYAALINSVDLFTDDPTAVQGVSDAYTALQWSTIGGGLAVIAAGGAVAGGTFLMTSMGGE